MASPRNHADDHRPGGPDPLTWLQALLGSRVYVDDRTLDLPADSVTFDAFPEDLHILELTYNIGLASPVFCDEGPDFYDEAFARNSEFAVAGPYQTILDVGQETDFRAWIIDQDIPFDPDADPVDYDMRGYWLANGGTATTPVHGMGDHFPDTYKTPYDTTFSAESMYATEDCPFHWHGDLLIDERDGSLVFGPCASEDDVYLFLVLNGDDFDSPVVDYFWLLSGTIFADDEIQDGGGALAVLDVDNLAWGRVRFPDYNGNAGAIREGPGWTGDGAGANTGGGGAIDAWLASGYRQGTDSPGVAGIQLIARTADGTAQTFAAGSRFTLVAY